MSTREKKARISPQNLELTAKEPKWIKTIAPDSYNDEGLHRIIMFYVIHTPCKGKSASGISLQKHGWSDRPWSSSKYLKDRLKAVAGLEDKKTFHVAHKREDVKTACKKAQLNAGFEKNIITERIAELIGDNQFMSLFLHIRNALAHGRFAVFPVDDGDSVLVMEDGTGFGAEFEVRARMVIKKSTLLKWIDIIEAGPQDTVSV